MPKKIPSLASLAEDQTAIRCFLVDPQDGKSLTPMDADDFDRLMAGTYRKRMPEYAGRAGACIMFDIIRHVGKLEIEKCVGIYFTVDQHGRCTKSFPGEVVKAIVHHMVKDRSIPAIAEAAVDAVTDHLKKKCWTPSPALIKRCLSAMLPPTNARRLLRDITDNDTPFGTLVSFRQHFEAEEDSQFATRAQERAQEAVWRVSIAIQHNIRHDCIGFRWTRYFRSTPMPDTVLAALRNSERYPTRHIPAITDLLHDLARKIVDHPEDAPIELAEQSGVVTIAIGARTVITW